MNQIEACSSGNILVEVDKGHMPIALVVELVKFSQLVLVIARAETPDPAFSGAFPMTMTDVTRFPLMTLARDPLVDMATTYVNQFAAIIRERAFEVLAQGKPAPS